MPDLSIKDVRSKYPQYNDMSDIQLADALHGKYYSDMEKNVFYDKIGLAKAESPPPDEAQSGAVETLKNIGKVYPVAETAANIATSTYGIPISGLAGLFALPMGLEKSREVVEGVQDFLVYQPQTEGGRQLTEAATYPVQQLERAGRAVGGKIEEAGYPDIAAAVHSGIVAAPVVAAGAKMGFKPSPTKRIAKIDAEITRAIDRGINKAIKPSVAKKEVRSQVVGYKKKARTTVQEIVSRKDRLNILDEKGAKVEGLPKTLDQFSQAIEQVKSDIFAQYDALARRTGKIGVKVDLSKISKELNPVMRNKVLKDLSPETIKYAQDRVGVMSERGFYSAIETQEAIQLLNQTLEKFYRDPSPEMKGKAFIDAMIANHLRRKLDSTINSATGRNYQGLKNKYGALRTIEKDVTKRSIVNARKNDKGLIDFSDVYTGYHIVKGVLSRDPSTAIAGMAGKGIARYLKLRNDPNRIVKSMFENVEKLMTERSIQ